MNLDLFLSPWLRSGTASLALALSRAASCSASSPIATVIVRGVHSECTPSLQSPHCRKGQLNGRRLPLCTLACEQSGVRMSTPVNPVVFSLYIVVLAGRVGLARVLTWCILAVQIPLSECATVQMILQYVTTNLLGFLHVRTVVANRLRLVEKVKSVECSCDAARDIVTALFCSIHQLVLQSILFFIILPLPRFGFTTELIAFVSLRQLETKDTTQRRHRTCAGW